ncbi:unnamed protein product [Fraxinus pennsylvanica]|uniref:Uncharacterized protein n=1 Tax=Fraxinus pennsylvanica TaxID=56036 RepID=A0AAD2DRD2_9LAMI|nr:unnamed protein product [Fraxinus pennsylvanica]
MDPDRDKLEEGILLQRKRETEEEDGPSAENAFGPWMLVQRRHKQFNGKNKTLEKSCGEKEMISGDRLSDKERGRSQSRFAILEEELENIEAVENPLFNEVKDFNFSTREGTSQEPNKPSVGQPRNARTNARKKDNAKKKNLERDVDDHDRPLLESSDSQRHENELNEVVFAKDKQPASSVTQFSTDNDVILEGKQGNICLNWGNKETSHSQQELMHLVEAVKADNLVSNILDNSTHVAVRASRPYQRSGQSHTGSIRDKMVIRGGKMTISAGSSAASGFIKDLIRSYNVSCIILLETRISGLAADRVIKNIGFCNSFRVEADGFAGGPHGNLAEGSGEGEIRSCIRLASEKPELIDCNLLMAHGAQIKLDYVGRRFRSQCSSIWRRMWPFISGNSSWSIGNGRRVSFWFDNWLGTKPLINQITQPIPSSSHEWHVKDVLSGDTWDFRLLSDFLPDEVLDNLNLCCLPRDELEDDIRIWNLAGNGQFSLALAYLALLDLGFSNGHGY